MMCVKPTARYNRIYSIPIAFLKRENIRLVFADLDNTLAPWHTENVEAPTFSWVIEAQNAGIEVALLTNGHGENADNIGKKLNITVYKGAKKPFKSISGQIIHSRGLSAENVLFVGDQLFTDIQLANALKAKSVLTEPISKNEWWCTRVFNRSREKLVWRLIFKEKYNR